MEAWMWREKQRMAFPGFPFSESHCKALQFIQGRKTSFGEIFLGSLLLQIFCTSLLRCSWLFSAHFRGRSFEILFSKFSFFHLCSQNFCFSGSVPYSGILRTCSNAFFVEAGLDLILVDIDCGSQEHGRRRKEATDGNDQLLKFLLK